MVARLHCANFWGFERFYWFLKKQVPGYMQRPGFELTNTYGCFPGMIWNGGRPQNPAQLEEIQTVVKREIFGYEELGIKPELTCNNISLLEEDFYDPYCNAILQIWEEYGLTVIVALPELAEFIKETYPGIRLKRSCVAWEKNNPDFKYDLVVLDQFKGGDMEELKRIPLEQRSKIELVANIECVDDCPQFLAHHKAMSNLQRWGESSSSYSCPLFSKAKIPTPAFWSKQARHYISPDKVLELARLGFRDYKLVSRCNIGQSINSTLDYFIKPEYKDDILIHAYRCFGIPPRIGEPVDYSFLTGGITQNAEQFYKFLQIW